MLELVLKKKWYDMIDSGEKKEEYRELKPYWWTRIFESPYHKMRDDLTTLSEGGYAQKHYTVRFRLGYRKDAPQMIWRMNFNVIGKAKPEWAEGNMNKVIVLPLRDRLSDEALELWKQHPVKGERYSFCPSDIPLLDELEKFKLIKPLRDEWGVNAIRL